MNKSEVKVCTEVHFLVAAAMDLRAQTLGMSRRKMLRELLEREFWAEEEIARKAYEEAKKSTG